MSLTSGTRLGPYEIVSKIGAGGMGEVYKATDTRLQRRIAIKVLPEHLASDPQRLSRFQREAQTISSLNHPHICALHDVGDEAGTRFLVMEYVEGESLDKRLEQGPLPLDSALEYASQIADALDMVHSQGIVHRDLKPGNVMITKSGVKLLDFGLAKLSGDPGRPTALSQQPTRGDESLTEEGTILGTFRYMAPEQLEGKEPDARTDIYALCLVLYEMIAARRVFEGATQASLIAAILKDKPRPLTDLQPITPSQLDRVVQTGLEKDPGKRWQSARELKHALDWIGLEVPAKPVTASAPGNRLWKGLTAALTVVAVAALVLAWLPTETASEWRLDIDTGETADPVGFALSPDGRQLTYVASGPNGNQLWLRRLDADEAEPLDRTAGASFPFWSPDGRAIGFFADGRLTRIDLDSRVTTPLAAAPGPGQGGTWGKNGIVLYTPGIRSAILRVSETGGESIPVVPAFNGDNASPRFLPNGRQFLFRRVPRQGRSELHLGSLDSPGTKALVNAPTAVAFHPSGYLFFVRQGALLAQRFDAIAGEMVGEEIAVADGLPDSRGSTGLSVSASGVIAYRRGEARQQVAWFDRSGRPIGLAGAESRNLRWPVVSHDGRVAGAGEPDQNIWIIDAGTSLPRQLTFTPGAKVSPIWSPDGLWVAFRAAGENVRRKRSSGAGEEQVLFPKDNLNPSDWYGDSILATRFPGTPTRDIEVLSVGKNIDSRPYLADPNYSEANGVFSPDGRWVAYQSDESGRFEIYVRPFPDASGSQSKVSSEGGRFARWSPDGKELYYLSAAGVLMAVRVNITGADFHYETPKVRFRTRIDAIFLVDIFHNYDVSQDGRFLMYVPPEGARSPITVILNWSPSTK